MNSASASKDNFRLTHEGSMAKSRALVYQGQFVKVLRGFLAQKLDGFGLRQLMGNALSHAETAAKLQPAAWALNCSWEMGLLGIVIDWLDV